MEMDRVENIPSILGERTEIGLAGWREKEREFVCKCNLDRVEPAERRKRDKQVNDTRNPLGKRVALLVDVVLICSRGAWGCC